MTFIPSNSVGSKKKKLRNFSFMNEHLGLVFIEDQTEFLEYLLSSYDEPVKVLLLEDKNNVICIGFLVDIGNIREF